MLPPSVELHNVDCVHKQEVYMFMIVFLFPFWKKWQEIHGDNLRNLEVDLDLFSK